MEMTFDKFGNYETPQLILCNPGSTFNGDMPSLAYGVVEPASDIEIICNYSDPSELNFRAYYINQYINHQSEQIDPVDRGRRLVELYMSIQKYRYVFVPGVGFFRIDSTAETVENGRRSKDVHAVSCDIELKNYLIPYIEDGTYPLTGIIEETGAVGILRQAIANVKNWSIGSIDTELLDMNRSFKDIDVSKNVYSFLIDELQEAFECVFLFDILNRKINVVSKKNVGTDTDIHLTGDDLVEMIKVTDQTDGPFTAFRVFGENAISIAAVNPLGGNVIYNFSNFIPWMEESLGNKVRDWQSLITSIEPQYYDASVNYYDYLTRVRNSSAEIDRLNEQKKYYELCIENIQSLQSTAPVLQTNEKLDAIGGDTIILSDDIEQTLSAINLKISETNNLISSEVSNFNDVNTTMQYYANIRTDIYNSVNINSYFNNRELAILSCYVFEQSYTDNYITLDDTLNIETQIENMGLIYHRAKNTLGSISEPLKEFTIDTEDFLFSEKFLPWIKQITPACIIHIEISDLNVISLFLSSVSINYEDKTTTLTFSNKPTSFDRRTLFDNLFRDFVRVSISNVKSNDTPNVTSEEKYITTVTGAHITTASGMHLTVNS